MKRHTVKKVVNPHSQILPDECGVCGATNEWWSRKGWTLKGKKVPYCPGKVSQGEKENR
jgi:hypothetical protein